MRGGAADARSDVFSLGVRLYELLTARRPFAGNTTAEVLQNIVRQDPLEPRQLNPGLPVDLCAVLMQALEKEPGRRYASAADLAADLRAFLEDRPVRARRMSAAGRLRRSSDASPSKP